MYSAGADQRPDEVGWVGLAEGRWWMSLYLCLTPSERLETRKMDGYSEAKVIFR